MYDIEGEIPLEEECDLYSSSDDDDIPEGRHPYRGLILCDD